MKILKKIILAIIFIAIGYFSNDAIRFAREFHYAHYKVCTLDTGLYLAYIDIYSDYFIDTSCQPLYYEVRTAEDIVESPMCYMCCAEQYDKKLGLEDFSLLKAKDGNLVAVVLKKSPDNVLAIYDFSTNETWPRMAYAENFDSKHEGGKALLDLLKKSTGNQNLILGS